jgi:hypothetical protein
MGKLTEQTTDNLQQGTVSVRRNRRIGHDAMCQPKQQRQKMMPGKG